MQIDESRPSLPGQRLCIHHSSFEIPLLTMSGPCSALVLFAHGARDPQWATPFRAIQRKVAARRADLAVELAFLELMQPTLPDTLEKLAGAGCVSITIAPLFMAQGGHLKQDLPQLLDGVRERHPALTLTLLPAVGDVESILDAISGWLVGATQS
jgi:sirohydrochlorin cobaltochelatase